MNAPVLPPTGCSSYGHMAHLVSSLCSIIVSPHWIILKKVPDIILCLGWALECLQVSSNYKIQVLNIEIDQKMLVSSAFCLFLPS